MNTLKIKRYKKRHQLLLEVMIAFAIIVICIIPLLQPHWFMLRYQQEFIKKIELDHFVNQFYADLIEQLYLNKMEWKDLENESPVNIEEYLLKSNKLPYKGTYNFKINRKKANKKGDFTVYLMQINFVFTRDNDSLPITFSYEFTVVRDLSKLKIYQGSSEEEKE